MMTLEVQRLCILLDLARDCVIEQIRAGARVGNQQVLEYINAAIGLRRSTPQEIESLRRFEEKQHERKERL
jgi:hypothetical protein